MSQGGADVGTSETVSLVFAKVEYEYKPQKIDGLARRRPLLQVRHQEQQGRLGPIAL